MNEGIPFKLFANCFLTASRNRALLIDVQRNTLKFIPLILYEILKKYNGKTIKEVKNNYKNDNFIDEYFNFLIESEYIYFTRYPENFPDIDLIWDYPAIISNAIIDITCIIHTI